MEQAQAPGVGEQARRPGRRRGRVWLRWAAATVVLALAAAVAATALISSRAADAIIYPARDLKPGTPDGLGLPYEEVYLTAPDQVRLSGWWIPAARPRATVLLLHGSFHSRHEVLPHAPYLHQAGYDLFLFDWRAHGTSGGDFTSLGYYEARDLQVALDYASGRGHGKVGVLGYSMGAAAAILEGARDNRLAALVSDSSFATLDDSIDAAFPILAHLPVFPFAPLATRIAEYRTGLLASAVRPIDHVAELAPRPILFIYGTADQFVPPADTRRLYGAAGEPKELLKVVGAGHPSSGKEAFVVSPEVYRERVLAFFARALS